MESLNILVAVSTPEFQELLADILKKEKLSTVTTVDQARTELHAKYDLIICGLHFDNGRMYELLKHSKNTPHLKHIPFLCIQLSGGILPFGAYKSMEAAFDLLGGDLFIQVAKWRIELGDEQAFSKLRDAVHSLTDAHGKNNIDCGNSLINTSYCM